MKENKLVPMPGLEKLVDFAKRQKLMPKGGGKTGEEKENKQMNITINEKEKQLLQKILGIAVYNGNHIEAKAFSPDGNEYKTLCGIFNKVNLI